MNATHHDKSDAELHAEHKRKVDFYFDHCRHLIPNTVNDSAAWNLCDLCVRYDLDIVSGDVAWLKGGVPYVTFRGMVRVAHNSGLLQGMEVSIEHIDHEANEYLVKAKVYKTGCEYPFEDFGDSHTSNNQMKKIGLIKIATTRAKCRALRSAFPIALPVEGDSSDDMDELFDQLKQRSSQPPRQAPAAKPTTPTPQTQPLVTQHQTSQPQPQPPVTQHQTSQPQPQPPAPAKSATPPSTKSSQPSVQPPNDGPNTEAWTLARKRLAETMNGYSISGSQVRALSLEMHGIEKSSELSAAQINSLVLVLQEENAPAARASRPTGPQPPPNR